MSEKQKPPEEQSDLELLGFWVSLIIKFYSPMPTGTATAIIGNEGLKRDFLGSGEKVALVISDIAKIGLQSIVAVSFFNPNFIRPDIAYSALITSALISTIQLGTHFHWANQHVDDNELN